MGSISQAISEMQVGHVEPLLATQSLERRLSGLRQSRSNRTLENWTKIEPLHSF